MSVENGTGRLQGRVALVSGSTRGIGRSIAELFAAQGAKVAVTGRTVDRGMKVVDAIRSAGGDAEFFALDITDESSVHAVIDAVAERFGGLTTLVNNAAPTAAVASTVKPLHEYSTEEWNAILTGTLTGNVFWACKYAWKHLAAADGGASIVNISSGQSMLGYSGFGAYAASKGGMNSVTRTLAVEGAPHGIRCNALIVGRIVSGRGDSGVGLSKVQGGIGSPMQVANAALFLASNESSFVNGELMSVDGGVQMNGDVHVGG